MWSYHYTNYTNDFLAHHGIRGQKWGVRRYQNPDGSLTEAGKKRYGRLIDSFNKKGVEGFHRDVNRLKEVKAFKKENKKERDAVLDAQSTRDAYKRTNNKNAHKYAEERAGMSLKKIAKLQKSDPKKYEEKLAKYTAGVIVYPFTEKGESATKSLFKAKTTYKEASRTYEKKVKEFCKKLLGEYGNTPIPGSLSVDITTGKISETPLNTAMAIEIMRDTQRGRTQNG